MLFRASGTSSSKGRSTPVGNSRHLRKRREQGLDETTDKLIENLHTALKTFEEQAGSGTVGGIGTPSITLSDPSGSPYQGGGAYGAGAMGPIALLACVPLVLAGARRKREGSSIAKGSVLRFRA